MKKIIFALLMVFFLPITSAFSVKVTSLYQAELPVVSKASEAKEQAVKDGFLQVLIKVSGNPQIDKNPMIRTSLKRADYYVHDYSYLAETPDSSQYLLQIVYEPNDVNRLLKNASVSFWGENRPLILVWLVAANKQHVLDIISNESQGDVYTKIVEEGKKYGLPLIFPVMDVDELNHVSPNDVSESAINVLNEAAKRYSPDAMLLGEIIESEQGIQSKWQLMMNDTQWNWKIDDKTIDEVASSIISQLNHMLVSEFVVNKKKASDQS